MNIRDTFLIVATMNIVALVILPILTSHLLASLPKVDDVSILRYNGQRNPPYEPVLAPIPILYCLVLENRHAVVIEHYSCFRRYSEALQHQSPKERGHSSGWRSGTGGKAELPLSLVHGSLTTGSDEKKYRTFPCRIIISQNSVSP